MRRLDHARLTTASIAVLALAVLAAGCSSSSKSESQVGAPPPSASVLAPVHGAYSR